MSVFAVASRNGASGRKIENGESRGWGRLRRRPQVNHASVLQQHALYGIFSGLTLLLCISADYGDVPRYASSRRCAPRNVSLELRNASLELRNVSLIPVRPASHKGFVSAQASTRSVPDFSTEKGQFS
jgi:hypothetical protein